MMLDNQSSKFNYKILFFLIFIIWIITLIFIPTNLSNYFTNEKLKFHNIFNNNINNNGGNSGSEIVSVSASSSYYHYANIFLDDENEIDSGERMKAAFVILVRNKEIEGWLSSMRELEDRFNWKFNYPYVFLNDQNFTQEFKDEVQAHTKAEVKFGTIPTEHWSIPGWIDRDKAQNAWDNAGYSYGHSESYRHMCRFESGFFFRHHLLAEYDYYWRVEPDVHFPCDINYDPFKFMRDNDKMYGFTMTYREIKDTIPTLWETVKDYMKQENVSSTIPKYNAIKFLRENENDDYNTCHFWSNFEIGNLNMFRSKAYLDYFDYLDKKGGFFYERWGDAPVHSIFVSIFLPKSQIHFFKDIGYKHNEDTHCPQGIDYLKNNCHCDPNDTWDPKDNSCIAEYNRAIFD